MNMIRLAFGLSILNLALLCFQIWRWDSSARPGSGLSGNDFELRDGQGRIRARFNIEPEGEAVLRMLDAEGRIRVKLGASSQGSGLVLLNAATEPGAQILAKGGSGSMKLRNQDGKEHVYTP
jgi:hypothetical protein